MSASTSPTSSTPNAPRRARPLFLHTTALSDAEYTLYVGALRNILGLRNTESGGCGGDGERDANIMDDVLELQLVKMQEIHEWMSGHYKDVTIDKIDKILHFFKPQTQGVHDRITGGQFFAAFRLLMHLRNRSEPNESLIYVQANLNPPTPRAESPRRDRHPGFHRRPLDGSTSPRPGRYPNARSNFGKSRPWRYQNCQHKHEVDELCRICAMSDDILSESEDYDWLKAERRR